MTHDDQMLLQLGGMYATWFEQHVEELKQLSPVERGNIALRLIGIANALSTAKPSAEESEHP
jgi:hypothetical protein